MGKRKHAHEHGLLLGLVQPILEQKVHSLGLGQEEGMAREGCHTKFPQVSYV